MTQQPRREENVPEETTDEDVESAMAVNAIDDDTRTHLDDPDETEDVQTTQGSLEHVEPEETESTETESTEAESTGAGATGAGAGEPSD